jgi:hypothetical protein
MYSLKNKNQGIKYYINTNKTVLYTYIENQIIMEYSNNFPAMEMEVIETKKNVEKVKKETIENIVKSENDFITTVKVIASTVKPAGFFQESSKYTGITTNYLNVYLNSETFINSRKNNKYKITQNNKVIDILKNDCPSIDLLLRNLFYKEDNKVILNFLNWLSHTSFQDKNQDIVWLFKGTSKEEQGQGAGKGILRDLLSEIFNGLVCSVSNETYNDKFNSELLNKKIVMFDEVNFKSLKYSKIKDITGNGQLRIENKSKDAIIVSNVASWMMFTNEYELPEQMSISDRRTFIIHPNPTNGSLKDIVSKELNIDITSFKNKMSREITNFIYILGLLPMNVLTPQFLQTKGHYDYWNVKKTTVNIENILDIFLSEAKKDIFIDFLKELSLLGDISNDQFINTKYFLEHNFYYQKIFEAIFKVCQEHRIANIKKTDSSRTIIKYLKDKLTEKNYEYYGIDTTMSINGKKLKLRHKGCVRLKTTTKSEQKNINDKLKRMIVEQQDK